MNYRSIIFIIDIHDKQCPRCSFACNQSAHFYELLNPKGEALVGNRYNEQLYKT